VELGLATFLAFALVLLDFDAGVGKVALIAFLADSFLVGCLGVSVLALAVPASRSFLDRRGVFGVGLPAFDFADVLFGVFLACFETIGGPLSLLDFDELIFRFLAGVSVSWLGANSGCELPATVVMA
jgi:hypothetical protein